jgi:dihydroflavonol-4-reductase
MKGASAVVHLASLSSWDLIDAPEISETIEVGTRNILEAARENGGPRVVFVSSLTAVAASQEARPVDESSAFTLDGEPGLRYAQSKRRAEEICQAFCRAGLPVVIVNPGEVYGPNDHGLITAANLLDFARSNPVLVCRGGLSVVHVEDVGLGIVRALERGRPGERYILGGENLTIRQAAQLTLDLLGMRKRIVTLPNGLIRLLTKVAVTLSIPLPYNPKIIPYATRYWFADSSKAQRELGVTFRPARDTLASTIEWLVQTGHIAGRGPSSAHPPTSEGAVAGHARSS